ncbi:MAG: hypothetical protein Q7T44_09790 [Parvibaculum sp.]|nr:hypothetical protein [Parvibaculum sp.]
MNEMIGRMIGNEMVVSETRLADFVTIVLFAVVIILFAKYVLPYTRR